MHLSSLKSFDWDSPAFLLFLAGLACFTLIGLRLVGIRPMKRMRNAWGRLRTSSKNWNFAWLIAGARIKRFAVNCAIAILFFILGAGWKSHQYALGIKSEKARELEKWKREYGEYQRVYTAWLKQHQELNPPGGDQ